MENQLLSLSKHTLHRAELFGELVDLFGILPDSLQPSVGFLYLALDLKRVLSRIENGPLSMGGRWRQDRTEQNAEQYCDRRRIIVLCPFHVLFSY